MPTETIIDKLERADGPSDELDVAIAEWCYTNRVAGVNYDPKLWILRNGGFTDSIDAAMTLLPDGAEWTLSVVAYEPCLVTISSGDDRKDATHALAKTPAIAIVLAALRARSQGGE